MSMISTVWLQEATGNQNYWFALDWLIMIAIVVLSYATAWAIYRFRLSAWVGNLHPPFHLRLIAAIVGAGILLIGGGSYALEYKYHEWDFGTFLLVLCAAILFWFLLLGWRIVRARRITE